MQTEARPSSYSERLHITDDIKLLHASEVWETGYHTNALTERQYVPAVGSACHPESKKCLEFWQSIESTTMLSSQSTVGIKRTQFWCGWPTVQTAPWPQAPSRLHSGPTAASSIAALHLTSFRWWVGISLLTIWMAESGHQSQLTNIFECRWIWGCINELYSNSMCCSHCLAEVIGRLGTEENIK